MRGIYALNYLHVSVIFWYIMFQEDDLKWVEENIPSSLADT